MRLGNARVKRVGSPWGPEPFLCEVERGKGMEWRRGTESNRRMGLLQSPALPLGYPAINHH